MAFTLRAGLTAFVADAARVLETAVAPFDKTLLRPEMKR